MKYLIILLVTFVTLPITGAAQKIELINSGELLKKGGMAHDSGQYKKALSIYNKIGRNDTNYVWSLYERALSCESDSQYKQAIKYCEEAFALHEQLDYLPDLYNVYGNTLHEDGNAEKALSVFDTGIAKFPSSALLYFNKGVVQLDQKKYPEAEALFQKALLVNPYIYSAHYQLGIAALRQGKIIPAYLCFTGYLLINPGGRYWSKSINALSQISKATDEVMALKDNRTTATDDNYQAVEDIVLSKIALDKSYKPIIALDDQISRQMQAIFEKLNYSESNDDFYVQFYFPFFKKVFSEGQFEVFVNHIFSSAKVPMIQEYNKKNKKERDAFESDAGKYFDLIRATRELNYMKRDLVNDRYYFEGGKLVGKGKLINNGKTLTGHWEFYYPAGNLKGIGEYNDRGDRDGEWTFYYTSGTLKSWEHHKNSKLEGLLVHYYENGNMSSQETYVEGKEEGIATVYYYAGSIKTKNNYKQDKKEGEAIEYYANGNIFQVNNYLADVLTGTSKEYYKSGELKETEGYLDSKLDGPYKSFHQGGSISINGQYSKNKGYGQWMYYYPSGKLKEKRNYVNDLEDGLHEDYFENGQRSGSYPEKKGKIDSGATFFYKDGKVLSKYVYDNGVIRSAKYFDEAGTLLSASQMKNNLIEMNSYGTDGRKREHFSYDNKGQQTGADTLFYPSGKVSQVAQYNNGEMNGTTISYYQNGMKKSESSYTDGKENGYAVQYYANGKIELEGWAADGKYQGEWDNYDEKGRLSIKTYYKDGDLNGYKEEYHTNGRKFLEQKFYNGWLEKLTQYDDEGNVMAVDSFPKETGKFILYHPNKKVMAECNYMNGDFDGFYKTYYFDGSRASSTHYNKGIIDSSYISFYFGGTKETEGHYQSGNKTGVWNFYDEDGKLHTATTYSNDEKNGTQIRFFPDGIKNQVSAYKDDQLEGIYIKNNPDGNLVYQINFEEGRAKMYSYLGKDGRLVAPISISPANDVLKAYFPDGKLARECTYSDGVKNGKDIMYYPGGQVWSVDTCSYNISEGSYQEFYPDGKLKFEYPYTTDNVNGICKEYNKNGTLKKEEPYDNGSYEGAVKYFDAGGKPVKTMWYLFGILTAVKNEK